MADGIHELAPHHLPHFVTPPGETDTLFVIIAVGVLALIVWIGNLYFRLHALPEKMAHDANSTQLHLVGVLSLLALFTHNNIFWVIALVLAAVRLPDFATPLGAIVDRLGDISAKLDPSPPRDEAPLAPGPVAPEPVVSEPVASVPASPEPPAPEPGDAVTEDTKPMPEASDDQTKGDR